MSSTKHPTTAEGTSPPLIQRFTVALLGATVGAVCVAGFETLALGDGGGGMLAFGAQLGLVAPLSLVVGVAVFVGALALGESGRMGVGSLTLLDRKHPDERRRVAAAAVLLVPAMALWLLVSARLGLDALTASAVAAVAKAALVMALFWGALVLACWQVAPGLGARFSESVRPSRVIAASVVALVFIVVVLAQVGATSGAGGATRMFGVLRREELDLRPVGYLALIGALAFQLPVWLRRVPSWFALGLAFASLLSTWGASRWLDDGALALATERNTGLNKTTLKLARLMTDRDGDGFASRFGGGDCDDGSAETNPLADDVPGNGLDEDCSGQDATPDLPPAEQEEPAQAAAPKGQLPEDLNIVLISVDTLRYDIGFVGYERPITPNLDALAKKSTYFDHAYALASYTAKSLGPTLIGRYGSETHRGKLHFSIFEPIDKMVQERLRDQGIRTVSVQGHWYFKENTGLGRGFDELDLSAIPDERQGEGDRTVNSDKISDAAIRHLQDPKTKDSRFYMWVHYLDPHAEYVPHEDFDFGDGARARYDGEVAFTDHHVGRLLRAIEESPFADRTAIVVTSDHGEAFGEHGMNRHGFELWDVLVRVPLFFYVPGLPPRRESVRRSLIDLVPTLLDMYGFHVPTRKDEDFLSGKSMLADLLMPEGYKPQHRPIFMDMPGGPFVLERQAFIQPEDGQKIITSKLRPMGVYDLVADPNEENNLVTDVDRAKAALERMKQFRRQLERVTY